MDPLVGMMSTEELEDEKLRAMAAQLRGGSSTGARLSTSSLEPVQAQGRLMQNQANLRAQQIGLMQYRGEANRARELAALATASGRADKWTSVASQSSLDKFEKQLDTAGAVNSIYSNFRDDFAGTPFGIGVLENTLTSLGGGTEAMEAQQLWWSNWKGFYENIERNGLFGSALTDSEKAEWKKANLSESMGADQIRAKLDIIRRFIQKKAATKVANRIDRNWDAPSVIRMATRSGALPEGALQSREALDGYIGTLNASLTGEQPSSADFRKLREGEGDDSIRELSDEDLLNAYRGL